MNDEDIVTGKVYTINFSGVGPKLPVDSASATARFRKLYPRWKLFDGRKVMILGPGKVQRTYNTIDCFKFVVLPGPPNNSLKDDGEWCMASASYFRELPNGAAMPVATSAATCNCNIWKSGCTCGVMAKERAKKNGKA